MAISSVRIATAALLLSPALALLTPSIYSISCGASSTDFTYYNIGDSTPDTCYNLGDIVNNRGPLFCAYETDGGLQGATCAGQMTTFRSIGVGNPPTAQTCSFYDDDACTQGIVSVETGCSNASGSANTARSFMCSNA